MSANQPKHKWLTFLNEKVLEAGTAKGLHAADLKYLKYNPENMSEYYKAYLNEDKVRGMVDDLVGASVGVGYYTTVEEVTPVLQKSATKLLCDKFGEQFRFDKFLANVLRNVAIAGFCPVETILQQGAGWEDFSKMSLTIIRPDTIIKDGIKVAKVTDPLDKFSPQRMEIVEIQQNVNGAKNAIAAGNDVRIVNFNYGELGNDVRGVSFVRGMLNLLTTLNESTAAIDAILKRYLSPIGVWRSRKSRELLQKQVMEREAGEDVFLGNLNADEMKEKIVEFVQIDPRVPFWAFLEYLDRRIWSYSRANDLWYAKDATVASAEVLDKIVGRHVTDYQRVLKRGVENYWFTPLVYTYFEGKEVPSLQFGVEKTGVEDIQIEPFLTKGLELGYLTQPQYFDVLKQLGVKVVEAKPEPEAEPSEEPEATAKLEGKENGET